MKVGVLTAALQELTPREVRDADPDRAIEDWLEFARELGADYIQLSAALHPTRGRRAARGDARSGREHARPAPAVRQGPRAPRRGGARSERRRHLRHRATSTTCCTTTRRCAGRSTTSCCACSTPRRCSASTPSAASSAATSSTAWTRTSSTSRQQFVPLLKAAKARGLTYRVEQCPMPGWTTGDNWHNNIAYTPGAWIALHRICEKHGVGDQFRIHYDPSHAILMGQDTRSIFQYLKDDRLRLPDRRLSREGPGRSTRKGVSAWGYGGQTIERGDWVDGKPSAERRRSAQRLEEADRASPSTSCPARRVTIRSRTCRTARSTGSIISSPRASCCSSTSRTRTSSSSTSIRRRASRIASGSSRFCRDRSPSCATSTRRPRACSRCSTRCCAAQGIPVQGVGRAGVSVVSTTV